MELNLGESDADPQKDSRPGYRPDVRKRDARLVVLKFGSSLLKTDSCPHKAVHEVYRHVRQGRKVLAVVSARQGETDALYAEAGALSDGQKSRHLPRLLRLGELRSAASLALALERVGVSAAAVDPHEIDFRAEGDEDDARPVSCDAARLRAKLERNDVVVAAGFVALDAEDELVLLGRGGTDYSAVFLGEALNAGKVRLIKDVDGVYDGDPAEKPGKDSRPYARLDWKGAERIGGRVVQGKALAYAAEKDVPLEVGGPGLRYETQIAAGARSVVQSCQPRKLKVALAGCGVVGGGVYASLKRQSELFEVSKVLVRDVSRERICDIPKDLLTDDHSDPAFASADVLVETMGGLDEAGSLIEMALVRGQDVVTANKALVARRAETLDAACKAGGSNLKYSAAVGGGTPVIERLDAALEAGRIVTAIEGVANGTCNFILDEMENGVSLEDAITAAQEAGYAEADPSADIDGWDAAAKMAILARRAFGADIAPEAASRDSLRTVTVDHLRFLKARKLRLRQVGRCAIEGSRFSLSVSLSPVSVDSFLARPRGAENCFRIVFADGSEENVFGLGAGRWPTAEAVVADLLDLHRLRAQNPVKEV